MLFGGVKNNKKLIKSIFLNILLKPCLVLVSFFYTPLVLSFLGVEKYGVWVTMLSVLNWLTIFDFGIGGGFRNLLGKSLVKNDKKEINSISSTAYITLLSSVSILCVILLIFSYFINWNSVFNTDVVIKPAVFIILIFLCLNFVFGLTNSILYANQKSEIVPIINFVVQIFNLFGVFLFKKIISEENRTISQMALLYSSSGIVVNLFVVSYIWKRYKEYIPSFNSFDKRYINSIFNYGVKLFFLQICGILLFMTDSIIITHLYSPEQVTPYAITRNLFSIVNSLFVALLVPFWSKYTIENEKKNYVWIKKSINVQLVLLGCGIIGLIILYHIFIPLTKIWLKKELDFPPYLILTMAILIGTEMFTGVFSIFLNGVSYINGQLSISIIGAILNVPLSIIFAKYLGFGVTGVCFATVCCQMLGVIFLPVFTIKFLKQNMKMCKN
ncbi:oligosaccharide flippase family protein [Treponema parvum]|uniref:Oligosaccharide flippase family protein n=1 Tax=Treponema parvum TaxID=138851 RepID=A0A975F516_9SPIR|nr:oligosaccharide flippase family protein [Treponema parvum]QTQ14530.1 oligosaccharide flippase family protein [Treponema parvum]